MRVMRTAVSCLALVFSIFGSYGCNLMQPATPRDKPPQTEQLGPEKPKTTYYTHIIKWPGENLIRIARWYTGSEKNWQRIVEANPAIDPKRIKIGDSILIPEDLMKTHEPMPRRYLAPVVPPDKKKVPIKTKEASELSEKSRPKTEEVELFGPIDTETQPSRLEGSGPPLPLETID